jgi:hypothetical protein
MFPVAIVTGVAWVVLFLGLLAAPPSPRSRGGGGPGDGSAEPPAVVSLLARRLSRDGYGATLLDLAARGWFRLAPPDPAAGSSGRGWPRPVSGRGPAGPVMCVVPAEAPAEQLTPYEQRVIAHVAARAGAGSAVPAPALSDGFEGGQAGFMSAFGDQVRADARERGLTRPRLSAGRIGLLCALLLIPAGALLLAVRRPDALGYTGPSYAVLCLVTIGAGASKRCSAAGRAALGRWHAAAAAAPGGDGQLPPYAAAPGRDGQLPPYAAAPGRDRRLPPYAAAPRRDEQLLAYAAALGLAPGAVAVFAPPGPNVAWSSYRGGWRQIAIETNTWSWRMTLGVVAAAIGGPLLWTGSLIWLSTLGLSALSADLGGMTLSIGFAALIAWTFRASLFPRFAEFDGQVIRQWVVGGDDDGPDQHHLAIDDGVRAKAWDVVVEESLYRAAPPGALVHARVSRTKGGKASAWLVEPAPVARQLADPGVAWDPRGHGAHGPAGTTAEGAG